jgi:hypothetical protein
MLQGALNISLMPGVFKSITAPLCYKDFQDVTPYAGLTVNMLVTDAGTVSADNITWQLFAQINSSPTTCLGGDGRPVPPPFAMMQCKTLANSDPDDKPFWSSDSFQYLKIRSRNVLVGVMELMAQVFGKGLQAKSLNLYVIGDSENVGGGFFVIQTSMSHGATPVFRYMRPQSSRFLFSNPT